MILEFTLPLKSEKILIKKFLQRQGISKHLWRQLKQQNNIFLNDAPVNGTLTLAIPGDTIRCKIVEKSDITPTAIPLDIIYEDQHILALNKASGILVHPVVPGQTDTIANAVQYYYQRTGQSCTFHPIHRLDKYTSGLLIIAKSSFAQHAVSGKKEKSFHREYLAIAENNFMVKQGVIRTAIGRKPGSNMLREINPEGQSAASRFKVLAQTKQLALVQLLPLTGRTHQLRVHLSSIGHPIAGDDLYGASIALPTHQALHSYQCSFKHPFTGQLLSLQAPLPGEMKQIIAKSFPSNQ